MTADDLEAYLGALGFEVERVQDKDSEEYTVALGVEITTGGLRGRSCDVALLRVTANPYVVPSAVHTRPALVAMDMTEPLKTQGSPLGSDWQYWSRRFDHTPTPQRIWAHVLTVLGDSRWVAA
jgi:hypothetical protein